MSKQTIAVTVQVPKGLLNFLREVLPMIGCRCTPENYVKKYGLKASAPAALSTMPVCKWKVFFNLARQCGVEV